MMRFELAWVLAILSTIYPAHANDRLTLGADDVPLAAFFDDVFARAPGLPLLGIRAATWAITFCPLFVIGRFGLFHRLPTNDRLRVIEGLGHSRFYLVRELPMLIKTIGCLGYGSLPAVQQQIGVDRPLDTPDWAGGTP
jgi:hypothetical protein